MRATRYSKTRLEGAKHTAATKLTEDEKTKLHQIALQQGISDYECTRRILTDYILSVEAGSKRKAI